MFLLYLEYMHLFFQRLFGLNKLMIFEIINNELTNYIYQEQEKNPIGIKKSNINGWHSEGFDLKNENLKKFINEISVNIGAAVKDMGWDLETQLVRITHMWAIINKEGHLMKDITMAIVH